MALNSRTPAGFVLCLCLGLFCAFSAHSVSLDGKWSLRNSDGSVAGSGSVPGCVHSALQQLGYIQDPYFRFNDVAYRWIAFDNWTYTTTFNTSEQLRSKQKVVLVLDGVDTVASVQLNGFTLGGTDNMFRSYAFSVRPLLKEAENVLSISLASPVLYASQRRKAHSAYPVPPECPPDVQNGQCHVNFIRKEQSSFSWDWGPSFPTLGLWRGVHLEAFDVLQLIQVSSVPLFDSSASRWSVQVELMVDAVQTSDGLVSVSIPELFSDQTYQSRFLQGRTKNTFILHINTSTEVDLWWPRGHGDQNSYRLRVRGLRDGSVLFSQESKVRGQRSPHVNPTVDTLKHKQTNNNNREDTGHVTSCY